MADVRRAANGAEGMMEACQKVYLGHINKNNEVSIHWDCWLMTELAKWKNRVGKNKKTK